MAAQRSFAYHPALDGVRALSVAAVLLFHGGVGASGGGFLGVDAFFVLSGFLITSLLLAEHQRTCAGTSTWRSTSSLHGGALPVLLTAPYTRRVERPDGGLWPEDQPQRVDAWNGLLRAAAERHGAVVLDLNRHVCPDGEFTWRAGGVRIRSDGLHFTPDGVRRHIAPWLLPQLARLAVRGPAN